MKSTFIQAIIFYLILIGCASQTTPTGGPQDEIPPVLISSNPKNGQKNFKGKTLELDFDEDVRLKDPKEEILITPSAGKNVKFTAKKNKIIIEPEEEWKDSTTYSLTFREGIQDLTEGNPAENLRLAFSTGNEIDSLSINGSVSEVFSEKIPEKITVALYQADTFDIFNHTPTYLTKSDKKGKFSIQNLKAGTYYIYAFNDKNKNLKIESKTEKFGYLSKPIELLKNSDSLDINLITVDARPLAISSIRNTNKTTRVRFNKSIDSINVSGITKEQAQYILDDQHSEIIFYQSFDTSDSLSTRIYAKDSVNQFIDSTFYIKYSTTKMASESFTLSEKAYQYSIQHKTLYHTLSFNKPLANINLDSIYIKLDSATTTSIKPSNLSIDSLYHTIILSAKIDKPADTLSDGKLNKFKPYLQYGKGAFISVEQDSSKKISKTISFPQEDDTGLVTGKISTQEKNFEIQLTTFDNKIVEKLINAKEINLNT
ncbi:MAG: Ig-like domain-containing protein [Flammeovirgaceae bacterium]|nr:Ig-like domain-containing protein [Flammeovirgaceae bacterium]